MVVLWLKTLIISDCAVRLHLMQTQNFQLLNTWHVISTSCTQNEAERLGETLSGLESVTEKVAGNAQPGACVDVLPRCWQNLYISNLSNETRTHGPYAT